MNVQCAWCERFQAPDGSGWTTNEPEPGEETTHTICPECFERLSPEPPAA